MKKIMFFVVTMFSVSIFANDVCVLKNDLSFNAIVRLSCSRSSESVAKASPPLDYVAKLISKKLE